MNAEIISIGTELLMGELVDTNSAFLASELAKLGIEVRFITKVGDDPRSPPRYHTTRLRPAPTSPSHPAA